MRGHQRDPVQGIQAAADAFGGMLFDPTLLEIVVQAARGETGTEEIGGQTLQGRTLVGLDGPAAIDAKAAGVPGAQLLGKVPTQTALLDHHLQDLMLKQTSEDLRIHCAHRLRAAVGCPSRIAGEQMKMRMSIERVAIGLDRHHRPWNGAFAEHHLGVLAQANPGTATELAQQLTIFSKGRAQDAGNSPDVLAMIDRFQDCFGHPLDKSGHPLALHPLALA